MLEIVQRALCLIGNASKFISQARRSKLLEAIEPSWSKYAIDSHVVNDTLFGKDIQASLTSTIEADSALFKAVSIVKWSQPIEVLHPSFPESQRLCLVEVFKEHGWASGKLQITGRSN